MLQTRTLKLAQDALHYIEEHDPKTLAWTRSVGPHTFKNMKCRQFLEKYCWVVYASGFRWSVLQKHFPAIKSGFVNFDPDSLAQLKSTKNVLASFNSMRKADCFLRGAQSIIGEGFSAFKRRVQYSPLSVLGELPGIGPVTVHHLAKDVGLSDRAKPDIWLVRAARYCKAGSVDEMVQYQSRMLGESQHTIDVAIWKYASEGNLPK